MIMKKISKKNKKQKLKISKKADTYKKSQKYGYICNQNPVSMIKTMVLSFLYLGFCPAGIYLVKVNNKNPRTRCEICSKLTIKTPERRQ